MTTTDYSRDAIEHVRDLCRARQIACAALAKWNIDHNTEYVRNAFAVYRDAADSLSKVLEIIEVPE